MKETLLTTPMSENELALIRISDQKIRRAEVVAIHIWLEEYLVGGVGLERLCAEVRAALKKIDVPERARHRFLGEVIDKALAAPKPKVGRGRKGIPVALKKYSARIVDMVVEQERLPRSQPVDGRLTAFERTAQILEGANFKVSWETVKKWYLEERQGAVI
jgi:hypothetical protein